MSKPPSILGEIATKLTRKPTLPPIQPRRPRRHVLRPKDITARRNNSQRDIPLRYDKSTQKSGWPDRNTSLRLLKEPVKVPQRVRLSKKEKGVPVDSVPPTPYCSCLPPLRSTSTLWIRMTKTLFPGLFSSSDVRFTHLGELLSFSFAGFPLI